MNAHLSDESSHCLACACANPGNRHAIELMKATEALTATGVLAAVFVAMSDEHARLVRMARAAIAEQRAECASNDGHAARRANCWHHKRRA